MNDHALSIFYASVRRQLDTMSLSEAPCQITPILGKYDFHLLAY